jgi:hypothetical protein
MWYALISAIHSNLPALGAVLADIDSKEDVDAQARGFATAEDRLDGLTGWRKRW